jgi:hypothetical protein
MVSTLLPGSPVGAIKAPESGCPIGLWEPRSVAGEGLRAEQIFINVGGRALVPPMDVAACKRPPLLLYSSEEVRMDKTVDVTIPVEREAAAALADARNREAVGRLVSRVLRPRSGPSPLAQAIAELKAEARAAGLSDAEIDAELVAYNAEGRDRSGGRSSSTPQPS